MAEGKIIIITEIEHLNCAVCNTQLFWMNRILFLQLMNTHMKTLLQRGEKDWKILISKGRDMHIPTVDYYKNHYQND